MFAMLEQRSLKWLHTEKLHHLTQPWQFVWSHLRLKIRHSVSCSGFQGTVTSQIQIRVQPLAGNYGITSLGGCSFSSFIFDEKRKQVQTCLKTIFIEYSNPLALRNKENCRFSFFFMESLSSVENMDWPCNFQFQNKHPPHIKTAN